MTAKLQVQCEFEVEVQVMSFKFMEIFITSCRDLTFEIRGQGYSPGMFFNIGKSICKILNGKVKI